MATEKTNICELIKHGSADAYRAVARTYGPRIFALSFDIIGNREDAEEVTSDTLMKVFRNAADFRPEKGSFSSWVLRIAHNSAISMVRNRKQDFYTEELPEEITELTVECDDNYLTERVKDAIECCPPQDRALIHLYYYDNAPLSEIAEITGVAAGTLAVRLQRIRKKIRHYIETHE
ncbi:MAG: sigma-70 family RNA polymerase sigma factor [Bacteroides sp.]|nr:sigma-70 family RNA polymerase sigma factor [Bacteroides sp.]